MLGRHIQGVEAVPLVFSFRAVHDREAHASEDRFHAVADNRQRMAMAERRRPPRQRHVDRARGPLGRYRHGLMRGPARLDRLLQFIGEPPDVFFQFGWRAADLLHPGRDDAVLATEVLVADSLRVARRARGCEIALEGGELLLDGG